MTVVLGLLAALLYGVGDFTGAFASRRFSAVTILLYSYPFGAVLMAIMLPFFGGRPTGRSLLFGVLGGLVGLLGVAVMYQLMVSSPMNVISPLTAVLAAIVPVFVGIGVGERPAVAAWIGIVLGLLAVVLVSRTSESHPQGRIATRVLLLAFLSGIGFGLYFVFLGRAGGHTGLWTLLFSRVASSLAIVPLARYRKAFAPVRGRTLLVALVAGACDALANMFFVLATHTGLLSLASVLTALYPAFTVLLAVTLLREHVSRVQAIGLTLAAASVVLITV